MMCAYSFQSKQVKPCVPPAVDAQVDRAAVEPHMPRLLRALLMCFKDMAWPVRDAACVACGRCACIGAPADPICCWAGVDQMHRLQYSTFLTACMNSPTCVQVCVGLPRDVQAHPAGADRPVGGPPVGQCAGELTAHGLPVSSEAVPCGMSMAGPL